MSVPYLSVVIPAYNEQNRLPPTLVRVTEFLKEWGRPHEILVVDDGSRDETVARARDVGGPSVTVVSNETNRGKGYSVRRGMLLARGERRLMTDADLSTPIEEVRRLITRMDEGYDVVIASRAVAGANIEIHQPWYRENMGRIFNLFVRTVTGLDLKDTQCGFKLFSARAAEESFGACRLDGFSFDVESLYIANRRGYKIAELPVTWRNDEATRVGVFRDSSRMFMDLLRIRWYDASGLYARNVVGAERSGAQSGSTGL
jgi:dolichyl-phosphate beta-glucosyltransferase